jgi:hypothetical protein
MHERSNEIDRFFQEAAQQASRVAYVLDPSTAIDRGTRRRRLARFRRQLIAGFAVLATVAAILVPSARLHLVRSSGTRPAAGPAHSPIRNQPVELKASDTVAGDGFGASVAISGATAVVGADLHANAAGRAYVFTRTASGWMQVAELEGSDTLASDNFGASVAISGTVALVGAPGHAHEAGRAYVFTRTASGWTQVAELRAADAAAGAEFGYSVAISGTAAVVGAYGPVDGRAYVFSRTASGWKEMAELKGSGSGDEIGYSVAVSGTTVVVAGYNFSVDGDSGAYVFTRTASGWRQTAWLRGFLIPGCPGGFQVAVSGGTLVVGGYNYSAGDVSRAYVYTRTASGWAPAAELKSSGSVASVDGDSVAVSGTTVVVGTGSSSKSGQAYVFTKTSVGWSRVAMKATAAAGSSVAVSGTTTVMGASVGRAYVLRT